MKLSRSTLMSHGSSHEWDESGEIIIFRKNDHCKFDIEPTKLIGFLNCNDRKLCGTTRGCPTSYIQIMAYGFGGDVLDDAFEIIIRNQKLNISLYARRPLIAYSKMSIISGNFQIVNVNFNK